MSNWKQHPLSAAYPLMADEEFDGILEDIEKNGLKDAVVIYEGMVLDGWHRVMACQSLGVDIRTKEYQGTDPGAYVISKNGHRRHLTQSQRAAAALKVREIQPRGNPNFSEPVKTKNPSKNAGSDKRATVALLGEVAKEAGVSERTMKDANAAKKGGILDDVVNGTKSASAAAKEARGTPDKPKPPTALEKAQAEIAGLKATIAERDEAIAELSDRWESEDDAKLEGNEQLEKFEQLRAEKRVLVSQLNECKQKSAQLLRETKALRRRLGE